MSTRFLMSAMLLVPLAFVIGCGQTAGTTPAQTAKSKADGRDHKQTELTTSAQKKETGDDHSGWWCNEHGVPEGVCAQCNSKIAAEFQKKRDWCKEHDRPDSQCFICLPEQEARFAAQYEAKFGDKPPKLER